jgi:hypothetical protein
VLAQARCRSVFWYLNQINPSKRIMKIHGGHPDLVGSGGKTPRGLLTQQAPENTAAPPAIQRNRPAEALRSFPALPAIVSGARNKEFVKRGTSPSTKK